MAQQTPTAEKGPSKETLAKVHQMKKKVEETIGYRLQEIQGRRLRTSNLEKQINSSNLGDDEKREILTEYVKQESEHLRQQRTKKTVKDFTVVTVIGKGAFGEVRIVRENRSDKVYAMKTMKKKDMVQKNQVTHILDEKNLMASADNPFLVKLFYSFQDDTWLYLVMEYCGGGDLMTILMREDILTEEQTRFYMAELSAAINAVHELDFVHRDLKPDNVLIANTGHVKLSDFGLAKSINTENDKVISKYQAEAHTLKESDSEKLSLDKNKEDRSKYRRDRKLMFSTVGTPDYIAPEVFSQKGYDKMVDWWSMGVIMFECVVGYPPFYADDPLQTCRKIVNYRKYFKIPNDAKLSREVIDLMQNLITSTRRRYGYEQIKSHPYFKNIQWNELGSLKPPFVPNLKSEDDSTNFETIDSEQHVSKDDFKPSKTTDKDHFLGYTFTRPLNMNAPDIQKLFEKYQQEEDTKNPQQSQQSHSQSQSTQPPQPQKQNSSKQQIKKQ